MAELFPEYSRSRLTEWIKSGDVLLDGAQVRPRDPLRGGEVVTLHVVLETQTDAQPEDIPLDVLFEDEQTGEQRQVTLVYPRDAKSDEGRISVLPPLGSALIGLSVAQSIAWPLPSG
ncbi:GreA/GreB family elongation factor, partial [Corallococcus sp. AB049A]|uniref:GreA/GreB family elongation factor n=1 Tax=Corallococcus sp. AB049A TaxID=2316721 RepID=UPI001F3A696D